MTEFELKQWMMKRNSSILEGERRDRVAHCMEAVKHAIPARTISERTTRTNIYEWLQRRAASVSEEHLVELLRRIIDMAIEASGPQCRVPGAVFVSNLKKQFGYPR